VAIYTGGRTGPNAVAGKELMEFVPLDDKFPEVVAKLIQCLVPVGGLQPDPRSDAGSSVPGSFIPLLNERSTCHAPRCSNRGCPTLFAGGRARLH
jgi:hypothetical protein